MRSALIIAGVAAIAAMVSFVLLARPADGDDPSANGADRLLATEANPVDTIAVDVGKDPAYGPVPPERVDGLPNRVVGKELIAVPELDVTELERLPPREPLSRPDPAEAPGSRLLYRPIAIAAGIIEAQGYRIKIAGIVPVQPDETCDATADRARYCGRLALTAFRAWLRGRAIECDLGNDSRSGVIVAPCRLGGKDAGEWLIENGWAEAEAEGGYAALEKAARANALGIFTATE